MPPYAFCTHWELAQGTESSSIAFLHFVKLCILSILPFDNNQSLLTLYIGQHANTSEILELAFQPFMILYTRPGRAQCEGPRIQCINLFQSCWFIPQVSMCIP